MANSQGIGDENRSVGPELAPTAGRFNGALSFGEYFIQPLAKIERKREMLSVTDYSW
jgi:hypothetical protein